MTAAQRFATRDRVSRWYYNRRAEGRCIVCGKPTPFARCLRCRIRQNRAEAVKGRIPFAGCARQIGETTAHCPVETNS